MPAQFVERLQKRQYMDNQALNHRPAPPPYSADGQVEPMYQLHPALLREPASPTSDYMLQKIREEAERMMRPSMSDDHINADNDFDGKRDDRVLKRLFTRSIQFFSKAERPRDSVISTESTGTCTSNGSGKTSNR